MTSQDDEFVRLMAALGSPERSIRTAAEEALAAAKLSGGFPVLLATFGAAGPAGEDAFPLRQMALTILRRLTLENWSRIEPQDANAVRQALVGAIAEPQRGLRGLLHACTANVRAQVPPCPWPELHAQISAGLSQGTPHEAACCVECVVVLLEEGGTEVAMSLGPLQEPMRCLAASEAAPPELRRHCVDAHVAGVKALLLTADPKIAQAVLDSVTAGLPGWLAAYSTLCTGLPTWSDSDRVSCAFTAVRGATGLCRIKQLEAAVAESIQAVLRPACLLVQQLQKGYEEAVIHQDDGGASEDEGGVSQLVAQLLELVQAMLAKSKLRDLLKGHVKELLQLFAPFLRITEAQASSWSADPNEFLAHEDDDHVRGCVVRLSGEGLVGELLAHLKREAPKALATLTGDMLERGQRGMAEGAPGAWKFAEVALFLFGIAAAEVPVRSLQRGDLAPQVPIILGAAGRLCSDTRAPEFLRARAFALLRRLGDAVCQLLPQEAPAILEAAAIGMAPAEPLVVRASACRVFCRFLSVVRDEALRQRLLLERGVLASLGALLREANEELLHMTLESLCVIIKQCPTAVASVDGALGPLVLEIWRRSAGDPLVHLQVLDLISCAASSDPKLQKSLEEQLLPVAAADLQPGAETHAASVAVELLGVLLKRASSPFGPQLWACVEPLLAAVMRSNESGLLQNACEVLCCVVQKSPQQIVDAGFVAPVLSCVEHLLGPDLDDDACLYVGPLAMLVLAKFGSLLPAGMTVGFLRALVTRLARAERPFLQQELVVVFARLLHEDLQGVLVAMSGIQVADSAGAARNGLELLLSTWLACAKEIRARRARNVTISALCKLHERCGEDAQLRDLAVAGGEAGWLLQERLLAAIVGGLEFENERCRRAREAPAEADDSDEDEDECEDEDEDDEGGGGKRGMGKLLSEFLDLEDAEDDEDLSENGDGGGDTFQALERSDPLHQLDLRRVASEYLLAHAAAVSGRPELAGRLATALADVQAHP